MKIILGILFFLILFWKTPFSMADSTYQNPKIEELSLHSYKKPKKPLMWLPIFELIPTDQQNSENFFIKKTLIKPLYRVTNIDKEIAFVFWLIMVLLTAIAISTNRSNLTMQLSTIFSYNQSKELLREKPAIDSPLNLALTFNYLFTITIMIEIFLDGNLPFYLEKLQFIGISVILLAAAYIIKYLLYFAIGRIFNLRQEVQFYMRLVWLNNRLFGLIGIFALLFIWFGNSNIQNLTFKTLLVFWVYFFVIRFYRGVKFFGLNVIAQPFHFLLYFCAAEIIPALLLIKIALHV